MKKQELKAIQERLDNATPGVWTYEGGSDGKNVYLHQPEGASIVVGDDEYQTEVVVGGVQDEQGGAIGVLRNADARFIAHAHQDIPALLEHIKTLNHHKMLLRRQLARLRHEVAAKRLHGN